MKQLMKWLICNQHEVLFLLLFFGSWFGIIILMFFVWYINKFQIIPEEEAMEKLFGNKYSEYRQKVRRWI